MIFRALRLALAFSIFTLVAIAQDSQKPYPLCEAGHLAEKGSCATAPRAKIAPDPNYTKEAKKDRVQGTILLRLIVGPDGVPFNITVIRGLRDGLNDEAVAAVKRWRFDPGMADGKPVSVQTDVEVNFRLPGETAPALIGSVTMEDADKLYFEALNAQSADDCAKAIPLLARVTAIDPQHWNAWEVLGICYLQLDDDDAAENFFKKQIDAYPQNDVAYVNLGITYLRRLDFDRALIEFRKQLEVNPKSPPALIHVALVLKEQKKFKEAIAAYDAAVAVSPNNPGVYVGLLDCYLQLGMQDEATKALDKAASLTSSGADWNVLAWTLGKHNAELGRAERYAKAAVGMDSANLTTVSLDPLTHGVYGRLSALASAWDTLGWILFLRGDSASAEKYLMPAWIILQHPTVSDHLAELYEKQGKKDDALTYSGLTVAALKVTKYPQESDLEAAANARARIDRLAPGAMKHILQQTAQSYADATSISIPNPSGQTGTADFAILQTQESKTAQTRLMGGDTALQSFAQEVAVQTPRLAVPGDLTIDVARWAMLSCPQSDSPCALKIANAREASRAQLQIGMTDSAMPALAGNPSQYSSESLYFSLTLPQGWSKTKEAAGTASKPAMVTFEKIGSLCSLVVMRVHLEATEDTYNKRIESALKNNESFQVLSSGSVIRGGISGMRTVANFDHDQVSYHMLVETFTIGDLHYEIIAGAPLDDYQRYAAEVETLLNSVRFPGLHVDQKDVKP